MERRRRGRESWGWTMAVWQQAAAVGWVLCLAMLLLPGVLVRQMEEPETLSPTPAVPVVRGNRDRGRAVRLMRADGTVQELTMGEYLWGVVAAEMPASFEQEALKAQAAAARTYTVGLQNSASPKHADAHLCDNSACCQAYIDRPSAQARWGLQAEELSEKITRAVEETDGLGVLYDGQPIQAVFFSSAAGKTVDAVEVWGSAVSYLCSVDSPEGEEVPNWRSQAAFTPEEVKTLILARYPGADLSTGPESWFGAPVLAEGGSVSQITVGGVTLTGTQVRSLFSLRSATFTVAYQGGKFVFDVTGYGHGVGMSQYGANAMAKNGADFREILTWYYTGTEVDVLWA